MSNKFDYILPSPLGLLGLDLTEKGVRRLNYLDPGMDPQLPEKGLALSVYQQLNEYFEQTRADFDLPIDIIGTEFQNKVWEQVSSIPYGESRTYGEIAKTILSGPRAVGNACRSNPVPIIIPCHRVVKKNQLGGYCGSLEGRQVQHKDWLLKHESRDKVCI